MVWTVAASSLPWVAAAGWAVAAWESIGSLQRAVFGREEPWPLLATCGDTAWWGEGCGVAGRVALALLVAVVPLLGPSRDPPRFGYAPLLPLMSRRVIAARMSSALAPLRVTP